MNDYIQRRIENDRKIKDGLEKLKEEILSSDISMSKKILFDFQIADLLEDLKLLDTKN